MSSATVLSESLAAWAWKRRDVLFIQESLSIDSTLSDSWKFAGSQAGRQSKAICHAGPGGSPSIFRLAGWVFAAFWRDCQSYLSQLCLAIRLAAPSVAFSFRCPRQMVPVQTLIYSFYSIIPPLWMDVCWVLSWHCRTAEVHPHVASPSRSEPITGLYLHGDINDFGELNTAWTCRLDDLKT